MQNFRLSTAQVKFHQICTLTGSFRWKCIKFQLKKVQRSYVSWHWRVMQSLKKNLFVVSKLTRIWWILIWALESLKNVHFSWSLSCKVYNVWPKKCRGVIFHDTEESCKVSRKTWGIREIFTKTLKSLKIETFKGYFYLK